MVELVSHDAKPLQEFFPLCQAALAAALVEEEWPDASELAAERAAAREAATPVPERVWALRNVAATAAMSGPAGVGRAVQLLEKAIGLKEEWVGGAEHPSAPLPLDFKAESQSTYHVVLPSASTAQCTCWARRFV